MAERDWREGRSPAQNRRLARIPEDKREELSRGIAGLYRTGAEFTPGVGDALTAQEAYDAAKQGDYSTAALLATLAAIGLVPGAGDAASVAGKALMTPGAAVRAGEKAADAMNWYHGTDRNILDAAGNLNLKVGPRGAVFLTPDPQFAGKYALNDTSLNPDDIDRMIQQGVIPPEGAAIYPVRPNVSNTFDINNKDHIAKLKSVVTVGGARKQRWKPAAELIEEKIAQGNPWVAVERLLPDIKAAGFDSAFVEEMGRTNLAVFNPKNVESAVGAGSARQIDPVNPVITKATGGPVTMPSNYSKGRWRLI